MSTLLLTRGHEAPAVEACRCGAAIRLLAYARAYALDRALARGIDPDSSPLLSVRAHALIGMTHRRKRADQLQRLLESAGCFHHRFNPALPVPLHVRLAGDLIEEIADMLQAPAPVDARGAARLELLLRDGGGPLYATAGADTLRDVLQNVIRALSLDALPEVSLD